MTVQRLLHYSAEPLFAIHSVEQEPTRDRGFKPNGLWVSVEGEDDWKAWCEAEQFALERLANIHEIMLADSATILRLATPDEIDWLTKEYAAPLPGMRSTYSIRWDAIARDYQGIIIAPYVWERRLDHSSAWYYPWDCASGCIWDANAIASVKLLNGT